MMRRLSSGEKEWNLGAGGGAAAGDAVKRRRVPPTRNTPIAEAAVWRELLFKERAKEKSLEDEKTGGRENKTYLRSTSEEQEPAQPDLSEPDSDADQFELNDLDCAPPAADRDNTSTSNQLHHQNILCTPQPPVQRDHCLTKEMANRQEPSETANDATLARLLQGDEYGQEGPPSPPQSGASGRGCAPQQSSDYELARQVQEEVDAEMAMQLQGHHPPWQGHTHHHHHHHHHHGNDEPEVGGAGRMRLHPYAQSSASVHSRQVRGRGLILPPPQHLPAHRPQAHHNFATVEQVAAQHLDMSYEVRERGEREHL